MASHLRALLLLWTLLAPAALFAQACPEPQRVEFSDGRRGCIGDYPALANFTPRGFFGSLQSLLPATGNYAVAATVGPASCTVHAVLTRSNFNLAQALPDTGTLNARLIAECESGRPAGADCGCQMVLQAGRSPLTQQQFAQRFGTTAGAAAPRPQPRITEARPQPAPAAPAAAAAPPVAAPPAVAAQPATPATPPVVTQAPAVAAVVPAPQPLPAPAPRQRVRALVIGNGKYVQFGPLANPANDARAVAQKFRQMGFEVDLVLDATRERMVAALNQYEQRARGGDVDVLYYAGHGVQVDGVNYLIPTDMSAQGITPGYLRLNGIALNSVLDYLPAKTRLVFLDACRDNPVARTLAGSRGGGIGLAPFSAASGTLIAYATRDGATADDGNGLHSPYTTALLQHLDQPEDIQLVLRSVRSTVMQLTSGRQEPWEYGSLVGGSLVLSRIAR